MQNMLTRSRPPQSEDDEDKCDRPTDDVSTHESLYIDLSLRFDMVT